MIRIGCAGWNYKQWKAPVYDGAPQREWLTRYGQRFTTVEVNSTFYRLPLESTVQTWAEQTPDGFLFAVKVGRYLTHIKRLAPPKSGVSRCSNGSPRSSRRASLARFCGSCLRRSSATTSGSPTRSHGSPAAIATRSSFATRRGSASR